MSKYTIEDVAHIIPVAQTATTIEAVEEYLNNGTIPAFDPCLSCEPNHVRKLISLIQVAERNGLWPPSRSEEKPKRGSRTIKDVVEATVEPDVDIVEYVGEEFPAVEQY